jgi:hypothetical protein
VVVFYDSLDQPAADSFSSHMRRHICLAWIDLTKPLIEQLDPVGP